MATIKDVARVAGVSISTASYALNNKNNVKKETKERILRVAKELEYYPNASARNLKTKTTKNIGVLIYGFGGPIYSDLLEGINNELKKHHYNIFVSSGPLSSKILKERQVDGAIIFDNKITDEDIIQYSKSHPVIVLDRYLTGKNIYTTTIENTKLVYDFINKIIDKGYKKLTYISGPDDSIYNFEREKGFYDALKKHNLNKFKHIKGDFTIECGYKNGMLIADDLEKPDFIFCANDELAIGLIKAFNEKNIKIPNDIAVAGFDGIIMGEYITPKLTTTTIDHFSWGRQIAGFLIKNLKNKLVYPLTNPEATITIRESV